MSWVFCLCTHCSNESAMLVEYTLIFCASNTRFGAVHFGCRFAEKMHNGFLHGSQASYE